MTGAPAVATSATGRHEDAVLGVVPGEVLAPTSPAEVVDALRATGDRAVVPVGGRTKLGWAAPPSRADVVLELGGLDRVLEHVSGDLVVTAEAGVPLASLQERLAAAGQWLALDPPESGATLGGVLSANASGPRRHRYGTVRDLLIGVTLVLADGTLARAGGKVVKNVAGYDLGKLVTGAHGTLGVVVETTWRLHPLPPARRVVTVALDDLAAAAAMARTLAASTLTPTAVELTGTTPGPGELVVVFESVAESVHAQADRAIALLGSGATASEELPDGFGARPSGELVVKVSHAPTGLVQVLRALPPGTPVAAHAGAGVTFAALAGASPEDLEGLRGEVAPHDGSVVVLHAPAGAALDHWGPVGDALPLMRRVKDRFDPGHRLSPGRFVGGI